MSWKAHLEPRPEWAGHRLHILHESGWVNEPTLAVVKHIEMETIKRGQIIPYNEEGFMSPGEVEPFLQAMLDCAWEAGMRPLKFSDHTNELTAVRYHLEDMRKLVKLK